MLTRKADQAIEIGSDVVVTVLSVVGGKVRLGIEAPPQVAILRPEVRERCVGATGHDYQHHPESEDFGVCSRCGAEEA